MHSGFSSIAHGSVNWLILRKWQHVLFAAVLFVAVLFVAVLQAVSMFPRPHYNITIILDIVKQRLRYRNDNENQTNALQ